MLGHSDDLGSPDQFLGFGVTDNLCENLDLSLQHIATENRESVESAALILRNSRRRISRRSGHFLQQVDIDQSLDGPIERARTELDGATRAFLDRLHDRVSMAGFIDDREEDVKKSRRQTNGDSTFGLERVFLLIA